MTNITNCIQHDISVKGGTTPIFYINAIDSKLYDVLWDKLSLIMRIQILPLFPKFRIDD